MSQLTDINNNINTAYDDKRIRKYIYPKRIVLTKGNVAHTELLTSRTCGQVSFTAGGAEPCTLTNGDGGENAAVLIDLGCEIVGSIKLTVQSAANENGNVRADIRVRLGESVSEAMTPIGVKNTTNDHAIRDSIISAACLSSYETQQSGFRFAYIELLDKNVTISLSSVLGVFCYRDLEYVGSFECSDELLNKIWMTAAYTVHLNMQEYIWDGIKRDRLVWIGDMGPEVQTILTVFGDQQIIRDSLDFVRNNTPADTWMNTIPSYSVWWLMIQHDLLRQTGNEEYLRKHREYIFNLIEKLFSVVDENGVETIDFKFFDWPTQANPAASHAGMQAILKMGFDCGADIAQLLGDTALSQRCKKMSAKMSEHHTDCGGAKQAAAFLAISGIEDAKKMNAETISPNGAHGYSTFMGYYILTAKALAGDYEGALRDIREYWGAMLDMGATTFWEDFDIDWIKGASKIDEPVENGKTDIHGDFGAYCYEGFRHSLCHGWASGPCPYLTQRVLGIQAVSHDTYRISPQLADLEWARGTYPTAKGIISVNVKRSSDGKTVCDISVPDGIKIIK